jgi:hypothetical protein
VVYLYISNSNLLLENNSFSITYVYKVKIISFLINIFIFFLKLFKNKKKDGGIGFVFSNNFDILVQNCSFVMQWATKVRLYILHALMKFSSIKLKQDGGLLYLSNFNTNISLLNLIIHSSNSMSVNKSFILIIL